MQSRVAVAGRERLRRRPLDERVVPGGERVGVGDLYRRPARGNRVVAGSRRADLLVVLDRASGREHARRVFRDGEPVGLDYVRTIERMAAFVDLENLARRDIELDVRDGRDVAVDRQRGVVGDVDLVVGAGSQVGEVVACRCGEDIRRAEIPVDERDGAGRGGIVADLVRDAADERDAAPGGGYLVW